MSTKLDEAIRARYPIIWLTTFEEARAIDELRALCEKRDKDLYRWSCIQGLTAVIGSTPEDPSTEAAEIAVARFVEMENGGILVMADLHGELEHNFRLVRVLRETAQALRTTYKTIVIISPRLTIPDDLEKDVEAMDFPLPDFDQLLVLVESWKASARQTAEAAGRTLSLSASEHDLSKALQGLTLDEARQALALATVQAHGEDIPIQNVLDAKKSIVRKSGALQYLEPPDTDYFRGYDALRDYLLKLKRAFTPEAREFGIDFPKGVLLVSPPGCGKSLVTKLVGRLWNMPVIRLDLGALFGSLVGELT